MKKIVSAICLVLFSFFVAHAAFSGDTPSLTLVFTGNSLGKFRACPTCGRYAIGGLDRRITLFRDIRMEPQPKAFVSLGYEFQTYLKKDKAKPAAMEPMAKVYEMLEYDYAVASALDVSALNDAGVELPKPFVPVEESVRTEVMDVNGVRVGLVVFPEVGLFQKYTPEMELAVVKAAEQVREQVDAVVGLSSWGEANELGFIRANNQVFDVLAGAGPGTGFGSRVEEGSCTIWVRVAFDGQQVSRLDVNVLAGKNGKQEWKDGSYIFEDIPLDTKVRGDARISALFGWL